MYINSTHNYSLKSEISIQIAFFECLNNKHRIDQLHNNGCDKNAQFRNETIIFVKNLISKQP